MRHVSTTLNAMTTTTTADHGGAKSARATSETTIPAMVLVTASTLHRPARSRRPNQPCAEAARLVVPAATSATTLVFTRCLTRHV